MKKLTNAQIIEIQSLYETGKTEDQIAKFTHISKPTIVKYLRNPKFNKYKEIHKKNTQYNRFYGKHYTDRRRKEINDPSLPVKYQTNPRANLLQKFLYKIEWIHAKLKIRKFGFSREFTNYNVNKMDYRQLQKVVSDCNFVLDNILPIYKRIKYLYEMRNSKK